MRWGRRQNNVHVGVAADLTRAAQDATDVLEGRPWVRSRRGARRRSCRQTSRALARPWRSCSARPRAPWLPRTSRCCTSTPSMRRVCRMRTKKQVGITRMRTRSSDTPLSCRWSSYKGRSADQMISSRRRSNAMSIPGPQWGRHAVGVAVAPSLASPSHDWPEGTGDGRAEVNSPTRGPPTTAAAGGGGAEVASPLAFSSRSPA